MTQDIKHFIDLVESKGKQLELNKLPYGRSALEPVMSKKTIDYHYGKLAQGYVDRFNKGEGDPTFNEAGAFLHNILFSQFQHPRPSNQPRGASLTLINKKYGSFKDFKEKFQTEAMKIQGSGWIYLSRTGEIKTIKNHQIKNDIALLIDWWEHAWALDYGADKKRYLERIWQLINWDRVNIRIYAGK
jgi:superoxide dismutase, Fe-Mn family